MILQDTKYLNDTQLAYDFTRYEHGCHWLDSYSTIGSWCVMERISAHFNIEDIEVPGL